ncbi:Glycoside hydrolase family 16 protein [Ceratobasidium theobromae]|uniref:Glycoside hydrolase family 16 protein n=1 Tax=Ceratobasidium theobromae TaxID=1582974 RepID=A0A5N5QHK3_9AGAM|nr:Glycoside hydrolase family 16 protein [Ceratobasidium theobromae]
MTSALVLSLLMTAAGLVAAQGGRTCNATSLCPSSAPCCSEFGFCGSGPQFCLGGCNPLWSNKPASCEPNPICKDATYKFPDSTLSNILSNSTLYDGNATAHDFVLEKGNVFNTGQNGGELVLTLTEANGGTRISSTRYVHYGTISATIRTSKWAGVVTAFITMSDAKDEIDWEWPGAQVTEAQTNYFWLGVANYSATQGTTVKGLSDTYVNYHNYTIDWQEDELNWLIDGNVVRTLKRADTLSSTIPGRYEYPSTPARIQLSLWPAGINTSAQGTIDWAGGMIDWKDPDYVAAGQFSAIVKEVSVKCAPLTGVVNASAMTSYTYSANDSAGIPVVQVTNQSTLLGGAILGVSVGNSFWLGMGASMLCAIAGVFSTVL